MNVLNAEEFDEGQYQQRKSIEQETGGSMLWGGLLAANETEDKQDSSPIGTKSRRSTRKDSSKDGSGEDNGARQRGRPRMNTRDKTAAEVGSLILYCANTLNAIFSALCVHRPVPFPCV